MTDPAGMLEWLIGVLQGAEDNQEKVFLLGLKFFFPQFSTLYSNK